VWLTHTHLTALCPGLPGWSGTRKVKPVWILLKQETVNGSGINWAVCKSATRSRQITTPAPHHSVFLRAECPSYYPTNSVESTEGKLFYFSVNLNEFFSLIICCEKFSLDAIFVLCATVPVIFYHRKSHWYHHMLFEFCWYMAGRTVNHLLKSQRYETLHNCILYYYDCRLMLRETDTTVCRTWSVLLRIYRV